MRSAFGLALALSSCSPDSPDAQLERGAAAYQMHCAVCHEGENEGIGPRLTPAVLATRGTAAGLFAYNQMQMPYNNGQSLSDRQYLDITAWMLRRAEMLPSGVPLRMSVLDTLALE